MKAIFKYSTSIFLSLMILSVSGGFTFSRMVCLESGYTMYAFEEQGDCCEKENLPPVRIEQTCCDILNQVVYVDCYTPSFTKILKADYNFISVVTPSLETLESFFITNYPQYISSLPPPLGGIDFLYSIHKLTV